jgi:lipopolysaccharide transport system ATP-binding protein
LNSQEQNTDIFLAGESVKIRLHVKANQEITNPTFGIVIRDRFGNDIFGVNNYHLNIDLGVFKKNEEYLVTYKFDLNIGENVYNLSVAVHADSTHVNENYDWINSICVFRVVQNTDFNFIGYAKLYPKIFLESKK